MTSANCRGCQHNDPEVAHACPRKCTVVPPNNCRLSKPTVGVTTEPDGVQPTTAAPDLLHLLPPPHWHTAVNPPHAQPCRPTYQVRQQPPVRAHLCTTPSSISLLHQLVKCGRHMLCASIYLRTRLLASHLVRDSCQANREAQVLSQHIEEVGLVGAPLQGVLCSRERANICSAAVHIQTYSC